MSFNRHLKFYTLVFLILLPIGIIYLFPQSSLAVPFISLEKEVSLGKGADKQIVKQYGIYQDKPLQLYVNQVGQKLVSNLSDKIFRRYFFKLVDSSEINAFALPGGYVYVTRGLLAMLNSEAELAGVMGHEIAHVTLHHGAKLMVRSIGAQILSIGAAVANPQNAGQWLLVSSAMFQQINLGYGRKAELESDAQGMLTSTESGYHPVGIVNFLKNLRRQEVMTGQSYHSFQASHPDTKDRVIKAGLMASSVERKKQREKSDLVIKREVYLSKIRGMVYGGKLRGKIKKNYTPQYIDVYRVQKGDTYKSIAEKELGDAKLDLDISVLNGRKESSQPIPGELIKMIRDGTYQGEKSIKLQFKNP
jgi:predicted Zn-dependent protease